jgi:PAS domain S-box-containing protein
MKDERKTKKQLIDDLVEVRQQLADMRVSLASRKKVENELIESEENYRSIFNAANEAIFVHDFETADIIDVNHKALEMFGYNQEELKRLKVEDISSGEPPFTQQNAVQWLKKSFEEGPQLFEWLCKDKNGRLFWVEVNLKRAVIGAKESILAVVRDITERKQAEEAIQETRAFYEQLIGEAGDAIVALDRDGIIITWNNGAERVFGWTCQEALGRPYLELQTGEVTESTRENIEKAFSGETLINVEMRRRRKDGTLFDALLTVSPIRDAQGDIVAAQGIIKDITDLKFAQKALEESEEQYRKLVETANDAIFVADTATGIILDANKKAEELMGIPIKDIIGMHQTHLHPPEEEKRYSKMFQDAVEIGNGITGELLVCHKDGYRVPVEISTSITELGGKRVIQGIFRDLTERKRAEEALELAHASAAAAEKLASLGRLTAGVSHEILNPLNVISLRLRLLADNPDTPSDLLRHIKTMEEQAERIARITKDLLSFARQRTPERSPLDLNESVHESIRLLEHDLKLQQIDVRLRLTDDLLAVQADKDQFQQVLLNLLSNARDAMPSGGKIKIETKNVQKRGQNFVELSIGDSGKGIPQEDVERIFEPFFTTKPEGEGTGLGLAVCRGIIESHGGTIRAKSKLDKGTKFIAHLPVEHAQK